MGLGLEQHRGAGPYVVHPVTGLFLGMLTLIAWFRWCLLSFSIVKLLFFSWLLVTILGEIFRDYANILHLLKLLVSIGGSCSQQLVLRSLLTVIFLFSFSRLHILIGIRAVPSPSTIYSFNYSFISVWAYGYFSLWVIVQYQHYLFCYLSCSSFGFGEPLQVGV